MNILPLLTLPRRKRDSCSTICWREEVESWSLGKTPRLRAKLFRYCLFPPSHSFGLISACLVDVSGRKVYDLAFLGQGGALPPDKLLGSPFFLFSPFHSRSIHCRHSMPLHRHSRYTQSSKRTLTSPFLLVPSLLLRPLATYFPSKQMYRLPPELLTQVVEDCALCTSSHIHCRQRLDTLSRLCLVNRQFRQIAQPLLEQIVVRQSDRREDVLKTREVTTRVLKCEYDDRRIQYQDLVRSCIFRLSPRCEECDL